MDPAAAHSAGPPPSPELLSPGGKSRYGRTRRPKVSRDFYNIDDVVIDEAPKPRPSPLRSPRPKPPPKPAAAFEGGLSALDDLGVKVANSFKQRGLDDSIKERKFFKSLSEKVDVPNVVDVTKVLKLIASKPEVCEAKSAPKAALKTYSNRRKHVHDGDSFVVESFGLPDEPIVPVANQLPIERDTKIDVDVSCEVDVNLVNPWDFGEFEPLYASEPITTLDELRFNRGGMLDLGTYDTNFEKSRIPTPVTDDAIAKECVKEAKVKKDKAEKEVEVIVVDGDKSPPIVPEENTSKKVGSKVPDKKVSLTKNEPKIAESPRRILRSSVDNNNVEGKKDTSSSSVDSSVTDTTAKNKVEFTTLRKFKAKNQVVNPVKLSATICSPQIRVILNPLSCVHKYLENKKLVPNPFKIKREKSRLRKVQRRKMKFRSCKITPKTTSSISESLPGIGRNALKKTSPNKVQKKENCVEIKEEIDLKSIKTEIVDFQPGDLAWAKIGTHPYWPCMVTQEPMSGDHKKFVVNRHHPLYHVRFFGDKGRRSWVSAQYVMLFYGRNDLETLAKVLKAEDKVKCSYIKESYIVKPKKLPKWQSGVEEAESLKCQPVHERLNYFFEVFASKREKEERLKELGIKEEILDDCFKSESETSVTKNKKRARMSEGDGVTKKMKNDFEEIKFESEVKQETPEEGVEVEDIPLEVEKAANKSSKKEESRLKESPAKKNRKSFSSEATSDVISSSDESKNSKKTLKESVKVFVSPDGQKVRAEETARQESPNKAQKKSHSISEVEIFTSPEGRKRITRQSQQQQEEATSEATKKTEETPFKTPLAKKVASESDDKKSRQTLPRESSQSPEKRKRGRKTPPRDPSDDSAPLFARLSQTKDAPKSPERKRSQPREETDDSQTARKRLRSYQSKTSECAEEPRKEPKRNSTDEEEPKMLKNKRHLVLGDVSNSDTDSKFSDNSSVPASLESQAALFRRNHIFRGIQREKVCQVCEEGGEVFKCKGPCNGVYHYKCAVDAAKEEGEEKGKKKGGEEEAAKGEEEPEKTVEIISVDSKKPLPNLSDSPNYKGMTLAEKIDFRMKEIMKKFDYQSVYAESTDSSSEEFVVDESFEKYRNQSKLSLTVTNRPSKKEIPIIKHVTADNISYICVTNEKPKEKDAAEAVAENLQNPKCHSCATENAPHCLVCQKEESKSGSKFRQKCSIHQCGKYYHPECLKMWPQTQWSLIQRTKDAKSDATYDTFVCPRHVCHTCISDDPRASNSRCPSDKVVKCLRCPATYHSSNYCVPAGTHILSTSQIVCPRHYTKSRKKRRTPQTINTNWCFICSKGGDLICCETCPTSVHAECLPGDLNEDDTFFCEDCQSGRLPLYDEIVWVKLGSFRWWPALILFPNEVPDNVKNIPHNRGEFVVKFYGTYDHYWMGRGRTFLFQEGDKGHSSSIRRRVDSAFAKAIEEAAAAHQLKKQFKLSKIAEKSSGLKPPPYIKIKVNKPVGNVRLFDGNTSNTTSCECDPNQPHPCGPDSDCLNRLLLTECNPEVCPAGDRCNNQCFEKREYPPLVPHRTQVRGWGLKTLAPVRKGQFVIEYVGEIIDEQEYQRRIQKMHEQKEENYYFLTIDKDRTLDAGPKGNVARFMNHSCQPNCETQKWTVNGDTRVGLFAKCDIPADTELTFNYNLECIGKEKKMCKCGAPNCSGFIGVKVKPDASKKSSKPKKKKTATPPSEVVDNENPCFVCGKVGDVGACNNKICAKYYHLGCVGLTTWPEGGKWVCPWHNCNFCSKRTIRCCVKCVNSFCPPHSQGTIRYDKQLGFICFEHDPKNEAPPQVPIVPKSDADVDANKQDVKTSSAEDDVKTSPLEDDVKTSPPEDDVKTTPPEDDVKPDETDDELDCMSLSLRLNGCVTSTPLKKSKEESLRDETVAEAKSKRKRKRRKSKKRRSVKAPAKNTASSSNSKQSEDENKASEVAATKHPRNGGGLNRTDPDKNLPIRKRSRLRCGNTL